MQKKKTALMLGAGSLLVFSSISAAWAMDGFTDVKTSHPNYAAIMDMKTRGLIGGYADGTFKPDQTVNRVEALKIILGAANVGPTGSSKVAVFTDTDSSQWYATYLNKAVELGVVGGYPDGSFKPTQTVNLAENLKMLLNASKVDLSKVEVVSDPFVDAPKDQWYAKYIQYAKDNKLIEVDATGKAYPAQGMTRGKLAEVADRLIVLNEQKAREVNATEGDGTGVKDSSGNNVQSNEVMLEVNIKDMAFNKADMVIGLGTKVRFTNADSVPHSVISDAGTELASPILANGDTFVHQFNTLGTFSYHCGLHVLMKGKIVVKPAIEIPTI